MTGLVVTDLHKAFGTQPVLSGVDLEVPTGELTAILGASGSGKTTLLRVIAGFERPDRGTVTIGGRPVEGRGRRLAPESRHIGYVPQEGSLFPHLSVAANIGFGLKRAERRVRVGELLEMIGLGPQARRYPHELSGGQQQRVALARALATRPDIVLLDEPFSSLDAALRASVRHDVAELLDRCGTTAVLVTHDQDEALSMADRVAVLRDGRFVQHGSALDVYRRPVDAEVAHLVGEANLVAGSVRRAAAVTPLGTLPLAAGSFSEGTAIVVLLRPEQLEVRPAVAVGDPTGDGSVGGSVGGSAGGGEVRLGGAALGVVVATEYHGHDTAVAVDIGGPVATGPIHVRFPGTAPYAAGDRVVVSAGPCREAATAWVTGDPRAGG